MAVTCLCVNHNVICRFFCGPKHYDAYQDIPVDASDCFASIPRNIMTSLGPLSTLCELHLYLWVCVSQNCLLDTRIFLLSRVTLKYFGNIY